MQVNFCKLACRPAIKTSTCMDKIYSVRAVFSGYSLLSCYNALVLLIVLVSMARACNTWKQNCNLSVCTDSLWVLVYMLMYFCLWDTAAKVLRDVLRRRSAATVPSCATVGWLTDHLPLQQWKSWFRRSAHPAGQTRTERTQKTT